MAKDASMDHALGGDRMPFRERNTASRSDERSDIRIASLVRATLDARHASKIGGLLPAALVSLDAPGRARA